MLVSSNKSDMWFRRKKEFQRKKEEYGLSLIPMEGKTCNRRRDTGLHSCWDNLQYVVKTAGGISANEIVSILRKDTKEAPQDESLALSKYQVPEIGFCGGNGVDMQN